MKRLLFIGLAFLIPATSASTQVNPDQLEWGPQPDGLADGALLSVLSGDPSKPGLFTIRLRLPSGYKILPHRHTGDELVTVIAGELGLGNGRSYNERKAATLVRGGYAVAAANTDHYAFTKEGTIIQITGQGPFSITYVRPRDDPRRKRR
jgi:quercetin dioxygenase-like cupin family protein